MLEILAQTVCSNDVVSSRCSIFMSSSPDTVRPLIYHAELEYFYPNIAIYL